MTVNETSQHRSRRPAHLDWLVSRPFHALRVAGLGAATMLDEVLSRARRTAQRGLSEMAERILVLGGGLAGVACARELADEGVEVTLVDRNDYHQFQPLLYQVATSQLPAEDIARPHRAIFKDRPSVDVVTAQVTQVHLSARALTLDDGRTLHGSHLVMAAGAQPNYFGVPGAAEHAFPLYSVADAEHLRLHLQQQLRGAIEDPESREPGSIDVVVVGGGPTGVETTGALAELMVALQKSARLAEPGRITLVDRGDALLGQFSEKAHTYALKKLTEAGAEVRLGTEIAAVYPDRVGLDDGSVIPARTVVWGGGESAAAIAGNAGPTPGRGGRLDVRPDLTVPGYPRCLRRGRRGEHSISCRRASTPPARLGGPAVGKVCRTQHHPRVTGRAVSTLPLQGQGHHGDDRSQRGGGRGGQTSPSGRGSPRLRGLARRTRNAAQRRAQPGRLISRLGVGLLRPRPRGHHRGDDRDPATAGLAPSPERPCRTS